VTSEWRIENDFGGSGCGLILRALSEHLFEGNEEIHENLS
jgi:hypothetical protein